MLDPEALLIVPCRIGGTGAHLYAQSADLIAFTGSSARVRRQLLGIEGVRAHQSGDTEFTVVFPEATFEAVSGIVRPARKRSRKSAEALAEIRRAAAA